MPVISLPRFPTDWQNHPHLISRYWDEAMLELERTLNAVLAIPEIQEALLTLDETIATATEAINTLESATESVSMEQSLVSSYIDPTSYVGDLISADASGNITIADHDRIYGDSVLNPTVAVLGDLIPSGAAPGEIVRVFYEDLSRAGGSVTYEFTVDPAAPVSQGNNHHSVGAVEIPVTGVLPGQIIRPPGYIDL